MESNNGFFRGSPAAKTLDLGQSVDTFRYELNEPPIFLSFPRFATKTSVVGQKSLNIFLYQMVGFFHCDESHGRM